MALDATGSAASFDQTNKKLDLQPLLASILLADTAALGIIGMGASAFGTEHKWNQDSLNSPTLQTAETVDSGAQLTIDFDDLSKIKKGALLMDELAGTSEVVQVTGIAGNTATVVRGFGSTDPETHADDSIWAIIGEPQQEGNKDIDNRSKARTQKSNFTQIFKTEVTVTGTAEAETNNGLHPGVTSEMSTQMVYRAMELKRQLNRAVLNGIISGVGSDTVYRSFRGLREFLTESGASSNNTATSEALSEGVVNAMYRKAWDDGGTPTTFISSADQTTKFATFIAAKVRVAPSDRVTGVFIEKYLTDLGAEISVVTDRWFKTDECALIDASRFWLAPLQGRGLFSEPLAKTGDLSEWQMIMEATLVCKNQDEAHAYHTNLT